MANADQPTAMTLLVTLAGHGLQSLLKDNSLPQQLSASLHKLTHTWEISRAEKTRRIGTVSDLLNCIPLDRQLVKTVDSLAQVAETPLSQPVDKISNKIDFVIKQIAALPDLIRQDRTHVTNAQQKPDPAQFNPARPKPPRKDATPGNWPPSVEKRLAAFKEV